MKESNIRNKSFAFAVNIVETSKSLSSKQEFVLSKQLLRSGTSIGAMIREAENAESKKDFIHKMSIAQKECNETIYWLDLLHTTSFLDISKYEELSHQAIELIKILTVIIKNTKKRL